MEENNIDKYFKEHLATHAEAPSDALWEKIATDLDPNDDAVTAPSPWRGVALMSLAVLLLISGLFWWRTDKLDQEKIALQKELTEKRAEELKVILEKNFDTEAYVSEQMIHSETEGEELILTQEKRQETDSKESGTEHKKRKENGLSQGHTKGESTVIKEENGLSLRQSYGNTDSLRVRNGNGNGNGNGNLNFSFNESMQNEEEVLSNQSLDIIEKKGNPSSVNERNTEVKENPDGTENHNELLSESSQESLSESDQQIELARLPLLSNTVSRLARQDSVQSNWSGCAGIIGAKARDRWSLGLIYFQNSTFRRLSTEGSAGGQNRRELNRVEDPGRSAGVRGYLSYALGKRLKVSLGLDYSKWKQDGRYRIAFPAIPSEAISGSEAIPYDYDTELLTSSGYDAVSLRALFAPGETPWDPSDLTAGNEIYYTEAKIEETIDWLSIPVTLGYQTYLGRLGLQGGVGLSYDHIVASSTTARLEGDFSASTVASSSYERDGYISALAEVGLFYRLSERTKIHLGPRFRSWLIPIYKSEQLRTYPYSNAIEFGIEIGL